jgi:hypothetical protein
LDLNGEQGAAKSTTSRVARSLVDPSDISIRTAPREVRDLAIAAANGHVLAYDNMSHLPDWLSDALCRISTGGGFGTRALYTDDEEKLFKARRPLIVNGIGDVIERPDLVDRAIPMTCPQIPEDRRQEEEVFWARFEEQCPSLFGALLDAVSRALRNLPTTRLTRLPRMADFARWATAAEAAAERGLFLSCYARNREDSNALVLEGSPLVDALYRFMSDEVSWTGTALDLWKGLVAIVAPKSVTTDGKAEPLKSRLPPDWPGNARALSSALRRLAPNLRKAGMEVNLDERDKTPKRARLIVISRLDANPRNLDAKQAIWTQNRGLDAKDANIPPPTEPGPGVNAHSGVDLSTRVLPNGHSVKGGNFASFASRRVFASRSAGETVTVATGGINPPVVGDLVDVFAANGDLVNEEPRRVVSITDHKGTLWVHVEGSKTGWLIDHVRVVERAADLQDEAEL